MPQSQFTPTRPLRRSRPVRRRVPTALALALCLAAFVAATSGAGAQSGRRTPPPISPVPTPSPTPEEAGESESESRPKRSASDTLASFIVYETEGAFVHVDFMTQDLVMDSFIDRLRRSKDLSATPGNGKLSRKEAQERAKNEPDSYIVLVELEEDMMADADTRRGGRGIGQSDARSLAIKTYVYEPRTGTLKFTDITSQRPYRPSTTIGGVRLPLPTRRIERFPGELQLEQAARDAADRIMMRFNLRPPPDY